MALLTHLVTASFGANSLEGTIPTELAMLTKLSTLRLPSNKLRGSVPTQLGELRHLGELHLSKQGGQGRRHALTGWVLTSASVQTTLQQPFTLRTHLASYLPNTRISGTLPTELGRLTELTALGAYELSLSGTVPTQRGRLFALRQLHLQVGETPT